MQPARVVARKHTTTCSRVRGPRDITARANAKAVTSRDVANVGACVVVYEHRDNRPRGLHFRELSILS